MSNEYTEGYAAAKAEIAEGWTRETARGYLAALGNEDNGTDFDRGFMAAVRELAQS